MLDDLKLIHERDAQDALGIAEKQWRQYQYDFEFSWKPPRDIFDIVVVGMGGSGLAAKLFKVWPGIKVPFEIVQSYELPDYIHENTLVIISSYSGNTEEALSCFEQATADYLEQEEKPMVLTVAAGGDLAAAALAENIPCLKLPQGFQPRMTLGYQLQALLTILERTGLLGNGVAELKKSSEWLKGQITQWIPTVPTVQNPAKQIAQELIGKSIVMYGGPKMYPAAYKWKISFNENAKHIAWVNQFPEFNHNEMLGWTKQPVDKPYAVIELRSNLEHPRVQKRFEVTEKLLSGLRPSPIIIQAEGETLLEQLLWTIALGDFVSLYLAILNGINPTPVDLIEKFKKELG